jgi:hypothetical protein
MFWFQPLSPFPSRPCSSFSIFKLKQNEVEPSNSASSVQRIKNSSYKRSRKSYFINAIIPRLSIRPSSIERGKSHSHTRLAHAGTRETESTTKKNKIVRHVRVLITFFVTKKKTVRNYCLFFSIISFLDLPETGKHIN